MVKIILVWLVAVGCCFGGLPVLTKDVVEGTVVEKRAGYDVVVEELERFRLEQGRLFRDGSEVVKAEVLERVRKRLEGDLSGKIFPAWYGTRWAFSGISKVPGEGEVACGYFVSNCLLHIGFRVQRIKLAQQASQKIIVTMTDGKKSVSSRWSMERVLVFLKKTGDGVYIVGLDTHVGFVVVEGDEVRFVHSSYYKPNKVVVCEAAVGRNPLNDSSYRVFGKLFDDVMLRKWLSGEKFVVR